MARLLLAGIFMLALTPSIHAEEWAEKMFEGSTRHDFGKVAKGAKTEYRFKFRNLYVEDVHVASVRTSCGCTSPRASQETLKTYDEASIIAHFNTETFQGQRGATLTVVFDKPYYAEVRLRVDGYIRSDVLFDPPSVDFGTIDVGQPSDTNLTVTYAGRPDWKITGVKSGSPFVTATVSELGRTAGQVKYGLDVQLKPGAPAGYMKEQLFLLTNDAKAPELPIDVEGNMAAALLVSPSSLFLGILQPGQTVTKQIVVQGRKPFKITSIKADQSGFEFKMPSVSKQVHIVPVTFTAGTQSGNVNYSIEIETDLGEKANGEIGAYAQITAPSAGTQAVTSTTK